MLPIPIKLILFAIDIVLIISLARQSREGNGRLYDTTVLCVILISIICILDGFLEFIL